MEPLDPRAGDEPEEILAVEAEPRRPRLRWKRWFVLLLFLLGLASTALAVALVQSQRGQRVVLDFVLDRIRANLAGSLRIDSIRSPSLLAGATLLGVHLDAEDDRPFLDADSVRLDYSLLRLTSAQRRVRAVTLYGPRVRIDRYAGEDGPNVTRLVARPDGETVLAPPAPILIGSVLVEGGSLEVLAPAGADVSARIPTTVGPDGAPLRRLSLDGIDLELGGVVLRPGTERVFEADLIDMSTVISVLDRPLRLTRASGRVHFGDAGLAIDSAAFAFPGSSLRGRIALGPGSDDEWTVRTDLTTRAPSDLADLLWLDDRIPEGRWFGGVGVTVADAITVDLHDVAIDLAASALLVDGTVIYQDVTTLRDLEVRASPLVLSRLEPWIETDLPLEGWLSGRAHLSGRLADLATEGRVTLVSTGQGGGPTTAEFRGRMHFGADPGVSDFHATFDPVDFATLGVWVPDVALRGTGRLQVDAAGRVDDGIRFSADVRHQIDPSSASHVLARGSVRRGSPGRWITDVQADLAPLSLGLVRGAAPDLGLRGDVSGSVRAVGPLDSLRVNGELELGEGRAEVQGTFDATDIASGYRLDMRAHDVDVSHYVGALPDPTRWAGRLQLDGRGLVRDSIEARMTFIASSSRLGGLHADTAHAALTASRGVLTFDTLEADLGGVRVSGDGAIGMTPGARAEARLTFHSDNVHGLRSIFRGDVVTARDSLSPTALELLRMEGVDVDTLPTRAEVAMSGVVDGEVTLTGSLDSLDVLGTATMTGGEYGMDRLGHVDVTLDVRRIRTDDREGHVTAELRDVVVRGRSFEAASADLDVRGRAGEGTLGITREGDERYDLEGSFALDTVGGGRAHVTRATFALDSLAWHLTQPSDVSWDSARVTLRGVSMTREGADPMRIAADGSLAWAGTSDLKVEANGLHLDRLAHVAQLEDLQVGGHLDLALDVTGPAGSPVIEGSFDIQDPRYADMALSSISGELSYRDREARVRLDASERTRRVFHAEGTVPVDLALDSERRRVLNRPMDVRVTADSLDASVALSYLDVLEDVDGVVSGDFHIGGTLDRPEPSGVLRLEDAAWSIEALGVRHTGVKGSLTLNGDRTVDVLLSTRQPEGTSEVSGRVTLDPLDDPKLDLTVTFKDFVAVDRRDVVGHVSGEVHLGDTYRQPVLRGDLTVDHGTLFLEEFARSAEVVDLSDPRFGQYVDTAALSGRPLLAGINNPFLQNLRVDVNMSVPRDLWLRSEDMNVEMGGDLLVRYDRGQRDIVLVGELEALRGSYTVLGRRFEVQSGTVGFVGVAGINPTLDIQALSRVRRPDDRPLEVTANVTGTLTQPRVTLSTDEQGIAESDLVSYLIFGRPSYQIATGSSALGLGGATGSVVGAATGAFGTYVTGQLATQLSSVLSEQIGLDYLSISQGGQYGIAAGRGVLDASLLGTQVELGQYIGENVFVVLIFHAPSEQAGQSGVFGGARVEVEMTDDYNVQGFWEDRFLRSGSAGFGDLGENTKVVGVFIFREWGY